MLTSSRASRLVGPGPVLAWVSLIGLIVTIPFILAAGSVPTDSAGWLLLSGTGNMVGLLLEYTAVRTGKVGIVASISSTEGAVTATIAAIAGEAMSAATVGVLAIIAGGIALASLGTDDRGDEGRGARRAVILSIGAAVAFGVGLYATGRISGDVRLAWVVLPARLMGVLVIAIPLTVCGRMRITRQAAPLVVTAGIAEVAGIASFALGARQAIGITSVLGSQFAAFAAIGAFFFLGERLRRIQVVGVVVILLGVTVLAALTAGG